MPKPYPREFGEDVVQVGRNRDADVTLEQVAADFRIHVITLSKWMGRADVDDRVKPGATSSEAAELRAAQRRIRLLDRENEVLRRTVAHLSQSNLPGK